MTRPIYPAVGGSFVRTADGGLLRADIDDVPPPPRPRAPTPQPEHALAAEATEPVAADPATPEE